MFISASSRCCLELCKASGHTCSKLDPEQLPPLAREPQQSINRLRRLLECSKIVSLFCPFIFIISFDDVTIYHVRSDRGIYHSHQPLLRIPTVTFPFSFFFFLFYVFTNISTAEHVVTNCHTGEALMLSQPSVAVTGLVPDETSREYRRMALAKMPRPGSLNHPLPFRYKNLRDTFSFVSCI